MTAVPLEFVPQKPEDHLWDALVIGTGAGGSTAGFNLARMGRSVLFVERGKLLHHDPTVVRGTPFTWKGNPETALNHGWWPRPIYHREEDGALVPAMPPIGSGAGGSTAQFGAVMDRFRPEDFTPRRFFPDIPDTSLPEAWPISYEEMVPFYEQAESLYRVRGTQDPLASPQNSLLEPPPASNRELAVFEGLKGAGLNPYRIHCALEHLPGCLGCPGMLCPRACRNDAARICLYPALERYGAQILPNCRAVRLEATGRTVKRVICDWNGRQIALQARIIILAANAFLTPALLQRSTNKSFSHGLANSSGLVGRNLMLHASNHLFARLKHPAPLFGPHMNHGLSINDFYVYNGMKLGNIHAHPIATRDELIRFLIQYYVLPSMPGSGSHRWAAYLSRALLSIMRKSLRRSWMVFAAIIEDLPYPGNYVAAKTGSEEDVSYTYRYPNELRRRAQMMCDHFRDAASPFFEVHPLQPTGALNGSHVCGTCRFGDDPRTSVLDRDNRAHDLDNLYVVDASFFPSSGGINPSLTIVANSLRVAEKISERL